MSGRQAEGINQWANDVHRRLQSFTTRSSFKDFVHNQGFSFLEEYANMVLKGPSEQGLCELAKTPGRKKDVVKKTRAAAAASAKSKQIINLANGDKENVRPTKSLHHALLQVEEEDANVEENTGPRQPLTPAPTNRVLFASNSPTKIKAPFSPSAKKVVESKAAVHSPVVVTATSEHQPAGMALRSPPSSQQHRDVSLDRHVVRVAEEIEQKQPLAAQLLTSPVTKAVIAHEIKVAKLEQPTRPPSSSSGHSHAQQPKPSDRDTAIPPTSNIARTQSLIPSSTSTSANTAQVSGTSQPLTRSTTPSKYSSHPPVQARAFPSLVPRSPMAKFAPRSPVASKIGLGTSIGPLSAASSLTATRPSVAVPVNRASTANPPPPPRVRSSWLSKALADDGGPSGSGAAKKSLGAALVAQSKAELAHAKKSMSAGVKRKSDADDDKERKLLKSTHSGFLARSSEESEDEKLGKLNPTIQRPIPSAPYQEDVLVPVHGESSSDVDEAELDDEDATSFDRLREQVGKFKEQRAKSLYGVDIDITARFNVNSAEGSKPDNSPQDRFVAPAPAPGSNLIAQHKPSSTASMNSISQSRSHERLSLSELVSSSEVQMKKERSQLVEEYERKSSRNADSAFNLLQESKSTTPPNSPPAHILERASLDNSGRSTATLPVEVDLETVPVTSQGESKSAPLPESRAAAAEHVPKISGDLLKNNIFEAAMKKKPSHGSDTAAPPSRYDHVFSSGTSTSPVRAIISQPLSTQTTLVAQSTQSTAYNRDSLLSYPSQTTTSHQSTQVTDHGNRWEAETAWSGLSHAPTSLIPSQSNQYLQSNMDTRTNATIGDTCLMDSSTAPETLSQDEGALDEVDLGDGVEEEDEDDGQVDVEETQTDFADASMSMPTSSGFLASATSYVAKAFGSVSSKNQKSKADGLKSLTAAYTAKREQEEKEKRKVKAKETMEQRRVLALQKKIEEDRIKQLELEKRKKEDGERRKREREEMQTSKLGKAKKSEDEPAKKRKITVETDKKLELKRIPSKDKLNQQYLATNSSNPPRPTAPRPPSQQSNPVTSSQTVPKTLLKQSNLTASSQLPSSAAAGPSFNKLPTTFSQPSTSKNSGPASAAAAALPVPNGSKPVPGSMGPPQHIPKTVAQTKQPSQAAQFRIQAAAKEKEKEKAQAMIESENIELPDINSEYSDSDDEDRGKDLPDWAQSPNLADALHNQKSFNPEELFGPVGPVQMEVLFKTRQSRFRARTSSANWNGADRLTEMEEIEYARRMGFNK